MEWDTAAGQAIVESAGGGVTMYGGLNPLYYNKEDLKNPFFYCYRDRQDLNVFRSHGPNLGIDAKVS